MDGTSSGEKYVAPPVPPTRNSFTMFALNVDRRDSDVVHRVDCWLPVVAKPGNGSWALLVVSGVELMGRLVIETVRGRFLDGLVVVWEVGVGVEGGRRVSPGDS